MKFFIFFFYFIPFLSFGEEFPFILNIEGESVSRVELFPSESLKINGDINSKIEEDNEVTLQLKKNAKIQIGVPAGEVYLTFSDVKDKIFISHLKETKIYISIKTSNIDIKKSQGEFFISIDKGNIKAEGLKGKLQIQSYKASISILNFEGESQIQSYSGPLLVKNYQGDLKIRSFESSLRLIQGKGNLFFHSKKSKVKLSRYSGNINGYSENGDITGSLKSPKNVSLKTGSGIISIYFLATKARVEAQSWEGKVYSPKNFYKDRAGGVYKAFGSIKERGDISGKVNLQSVSGKISIL